MTPHIIRLRGLWDYEVRSEAAGQSLRAGRAELDTDWSTILGNDLGARLRLLRRFGCPTGLQPTEQVVLAIKLEPIGAEAWMNDRSLGALSRDDAPARFLIHELLQPRNLLVLEVRKPPTIADVWLEIG